MSPDRITARLSAPDVRETLERNIREQIDAHCIIEYPSVKEIATMMNVAEGTVKAYLSRGREHLRNKLIYNQSRQI